MAQDTNSVDVILDFLRRNQFTTVEEALRTDLHNHNNHKKEVKSRVQTSDIIITPIQDHKQHFPSLPPLQLPLPLLNWDDKFEPDVPIQLPIHSSGLLIFNFLYFFLIITTL